LRRPLPRRHLCLAVVFLAAWILPPFWGIATLETVNIQDDIFASDLWNDRLPARAAIGASIRRGDDPTWMPGIYTGFPSLAQIEYATLYPSNLVLFTLLSPYTAIAWAQLLPLFVAGLGMFVLASELGLPLESRLFASGAFALSGFLIVHFRQLNMVDAAAWLPFLLAATERIAARRPGRAPFWLAVVWSLELLAGHTQVAYYGGLLVGGFFLLRRWQLRREIALRELPRDSVVALAVPIALGTLVAAAQLLPAAELTRLTYRQGGLSFANAAQYAVSPLSFSTFFAPDLFGDARNDSFALSGLFWEQYGYLGIVPALCAVVAIVVRRRDAHVRTLAAIGIVGFLLMVGRNTPLYALAFEIVPGMAYFRFPSRFLVFCEIAIALLAGYGLAALLEAAPARSRKALAALLLTITAGDLWFHQMRQVPQVESRRWLAPFGTEQALRAMQKSSPEPWRYYTLDPAVVHGQIFHAARGWSGDLTPYLQLRTLLQPSFNLLFGLESPDGYSNLVPRHYEAVWGSEKKRGISSARSLATGKLDAGLAAALRSFNVRYILSIAPIESPALRLAEQTPEGVSIYELDGWLRRAFVVGEVVRADDDDRAVAAMSSPAFAPDRRAVVVGPEVTLPSGSEASKAVEITRRTNTAVVVRAKLAKPGLLVLSEGYYPGWRARVDGVEVPVHRVNVMMRGVVLEAGDHEIVFRFASATIRAGLAISLAAIVVLAVVRRRLRIEATPA